MKTPYWMAIAAIFILVCLCGATLVNFPIYQGLLQSDLNSGGYNITNLAGIQMSGNIYLTNVGTGKLLRTDSNYKAAAVTIGSGLLFDGITLSSSSSGGSVTSVAISGPSEITWIGSPITTSGTLSGTTAGFIVTNGESQATTVSNNWIVDTTHYLTGKLAAVSITNASLTASRVVLSDANKAEAIASASGAVPIDADGTAAIAAQINALFPGFIVTNGESQATTISNNWTVDATHYLTGYVAAASVTNAALTASRMVLSDANKALASAAASGAVPINADGSATTAAQINSLFPGNIVTNGESQAITVSNNWIVDVTHYLTGYVAAVSVTNAALTASRMVLSDANKALTSAAASGAVPIDADGSATTAAQINSLFPGSIVTNGESLIITHSNNLIVDTTHYLTGQVAAVSITNAALTGSRMVISDANKALASATASGAVPINADGSASTASQINSLFPGSIVTNGESLSITHSNNLIVDPTHYLTGQVAAVQITNAALTASRVVLSDANKAEVSAAASGAVPIDADGSATTFAQVNALASAFILTNNTTTAMVLSNTLKIDAQHALSLSNLTTGHVLQVGSDSTISSVSSGAVPINGDGTATTASQLNGVMAGNGFNINATPETNNIVGPKSSNYNVATSDWLVLMNGNLSATLPTASGIAGKVFVIKCVTSGTNAILTTSSQTIDGATKWTNTAVNKFTWVISDNSNWRVIGQN